MIANKMTSCEWDTLLIALAAGLTTAATFRSEISFRSARGTFSQLGE
jgi:hypothetical protein